jgi:hypothetical protein
MKKYRIYQANVFDGERKFISARDLKWEPTEYVYNNYNEAYVHKCDLALTSTHYYSVREEE